MKRLLVIGLIAVMPFSIASAAAKKSKKKKPSVVTKIESVKTKSNSKIEPIRIDSQKRALAGKDSKLPKAFGDAVIEEAPPVPQQRMPANKQN